jgi:glycine/D-amino acid oxidase-like deaminating enzyme
MGFSAEVVICGAGIAGISAAYHLSVKHGIRDILLVDERPPLSLTSDKSTECYRNWWPGPGSAMVGLMNRSITILEELARQSGNVFHLNRRGYLYLTADQEHKEAFVRAAYEPPTLGAGELRVHRGEAGEPEYFPAPPEDFENQPDGADLLLDPHLIQAHYPYLSPQVVAALHVRKAGWFSAQQLGAYLLEQARQHGVKLVNASLTGVGIRQGAVETVTLNNSEIVATRSFIDAGGPFLNTVSHMLGVELPVHQEVHLKVAFRDLLGVIRRDAPMLIWNDPQIIPWSADEQELLDEDDTRWLLGSMPSGVHTRPEGASDSDILLMLWEYHQHSDHPSELIIPPPLDEQYPEIVLRGLATMVPGLRQYLNKAPRPILDGGYYTKTRENRPLVGPLPVRGAFVIGALSGYGLMAACGAGELLATHVTGSALPEYAPAFTLERYSDPAYVQMLENWVVSGQL